jgi:L-fuconolactonase
LTKTLAGGLDRLGQWQAWLDKRHELPLDTDLPIIDPHHHLWDRAGHTYLSREFLEDASGGHAVSATVYVECRSNYRQQGPEHLRCVGETEFVCRLLCAPTQYAATKIGAGIVGFADLSLGGDVAEVLDAHVSAAGARFKGVRYATAWDSQPEIHGSYPTRSGMLLEPMVQAGARVLQSRGQSLDIWTYFHQLGDVWSLAKACPDLNIVVDHCGGPIGLGSYAKCREQVFDRWRSALHKLRPLHNVSLKFGGLAMNLAGFAWRNREIPPESVDLAMAWRPYFNECLDVFGADRCMFESNFPVDRTGCTYTSLWNAFKRLTAELSDRERRALFGATAQRVYRL